MNQKLAIIIFSFAFVVAIVVGFFSRTDEEKPTPSDFRAKVRATLPNLKASPKQKEESSSGSAKRDPAAVERKKTERLSEEDFTKKYGDEITYERFEGRVTRIDGIRADPDTLEGPNRVPGFQVSSKSDLLARGDEILNDAKSVLGMDEKTSLLEPLVEPGDTTGRVTYQQAVGGVPVYPGGTVTIILGPRGEIKRLDSSFYPNMRVVNRATRPQPVNTRKVLYVTESAPVALLHYAYDSRENGMQRVTDAESGEILFERDRRIK